MRTERDHCIEVADKHSTTECNHSSGTVKMSRDEFVAILMRERADARSASLFLMRAKVREAIGEDET